MSERAFIVGGKAIEPPPGLDVLNFNAAGIHRFRCHDRAGKPVTELVIHETVTRSAEETVAVGLVDGGRSGPTAARV